MNGDLSNPSRNSRRPVRRPIVAENLEPRLLMHGADEDTVYPFGTLVPWLTPAITPADSGGTSPPPVPPPPPPVVPPPPPPPGSTVGLAGLTLINAGTDADIGPLTAGAVLDLNAGTFSVRADVIVGGAVGSVQFLLNGQLIRTESSAPFAVAGDTAGDYLAWNVPAGSHTLRAVPFAGANAAGEQGTPIDVAITVTGSSSSSNFTQLSYVTKASAPSIRSEALTATWNGRLYVFGGFAGSAGPVTRSDYYTPATNTWTQIQKLPQPITHAGVAQDDNSVYLVGAYVGNGDGTGYGQTFGSNKVWRYDFATDSYTAITNLPRPLAGGGAALVGRKLHYFGGYELNRTDSTVHLVLDLDNQAAGWQTAAAMTNTRNHQGVAVVDGKIYAIAGQTGTDEGLVTRSSVQVYDPATNTWTSKASMPQAASHTQSATFVFQGRILVMGGETAHNVPTRGVYAYDPVANTWATLTLLPAARYSGVAGAIDGKIYFTTGSAQTTTWEVTPVG